MWIIKEVNKGTIYHLLCGVPLHVGRQGKGVKYIEIADNTVSGSHALLQLSYDERNINTTQNLAKVLLSDLNSANGTYICRNNERFKLGKNSPPSEIKHGDIIYFGKCSAWRLVHQPLIVAASQIKSKDSKIKLKKVIVKLGGHLVKDWHRHCTHLVMNEIFLTAKTVCALASGVPIVTPTYLDELVACVTDKRNLPSIDNFLPPLKEPSLNASEASFLPDTERASLFQGRLFIFQSSTSMSRMRESVELAGGKCSLLCEENLNSLLQPFHIFVKSISEDSTVSSYLISKARDLLKKNGLNAIPESDIGLAVVFKSCDKFCNPEFKVDDILKSVPSKNQTENLKIYALETQPMDVSPHHSSFPLLSRTTVVESGQSTDANQSGKSCNLQCFKAPNEDNHGSLRLSDAHDTHKIKASVEQTTEIFGAKRKRSSDSPNSSRIKKPLILDNHQSGSFAVASQTQVSRGAGSQDDTKLLDDISMSDAFAAGSQGSIPSQLFQPPCSSTQIEEPNLQYKQLRAEDGAFSIPKAPPVKGRNALPNARESVSVKDKNMIMEDGHMTGQIQSVPFDPYTLPSFVTDNVSSPCSSVKSLSDSAPDKDGLGNLGSSFRPSGAQDVSGVTRMEKVKTRQKNEKLDGSNLTALINRSKNCTNSITEDIVDRHDEDNRLSDNDLSIKDEPILDCPNDTKDSSIDANEIEGSPVHFKQEPLSFDDPLDVVEEQSPAIQVFELTRLRENEGHSCTDTQSKRGEPRLSSGRDIESGTTYRNEGTSILHKGEGVLNAVSSGVSREKNEFELPCRSHKRGRIFSDSAAQNQSTPEPKRIKQEIDDQTSLPTAPQMEASSTVWDNEFHQSERSDTSVPEGLVESSRAGSTDSSSVDVKQEVTNSQDEVNELSNNLHKSLIVVKVVSLVKLTQPSSSTNSKSSTCHLPNFKKFKKVPFGFSQLQTSLPLNNSTCATQLPVIIGGTDLVPHNRRSVSKDLTQTQPPFLHGFDNGEANGNSRREDSGEDPNFDPAFRLVVPRKGRLGI